MEMLSQAVARPQRAVTEEARAAPTHERAAILPGEELVRQKVARKLDADGGDRSAAVDSLPEGAGAEDNVGSELGRSSQPGEDPRPV